MNMNMNLICSTGRAGDKTNGTLLGAELTAKAIHKKFNIKTLAVGKYYPPQQDDWSLSLPQAKETLENIRATISKNIEKRKVTVLISNACSISLATMPVVVKNYPDIKILWIDAHGDFNTPNTSETGYLGGMVVSAICGLWDSGHGAGVRAEQIALVGTHDIDPAEAELIRKAEIKIFPPEKVLPINILEFIGDSKVWIHVDWDVLEPGSIPADYQVRGGITLKQIQNVFKAIPVDQVLGLELAEFQDDAGSGNIPEAIENIVNTFELLFDLN